MKDWKKKEYSYAKMLLGSIAVVAVFCLADFLVPEFWKTGKIPFFHSGDNNYHAEVAEAVTESGEAETAVEETVTETPEETESQEAAANQAELVLRKEWETEETEEPGSSEEESQQLEQGVYTADRSYFDDALFIGDSRTEGLYEYGNLQGAKVLAATGMNVYKVFETEFPMPDGEMKTLEQVVEENDFGKVYIMLGVNELGYDFDTTLDKYKELLYWIQEKEPYALIFLQANMHVTEKMSEESPYCKNDKIDRFNEATKELADGETVFYLDVNTLFDNEHGALDTQYTVDQSHVLGKYYIPWVDWILTQAR